jgi:hypothetical protein
MPVAQSNTEYWFRLAYECLHGACYGSIQSAQLSAELTRLWFWIVVIGYTVSAIGLFVVVYTLVRLYELRHREEEFYSTVIAQPGATGDTNPRWKHIETLLGSENMNDWRTAIMEADIMLDEMLTKKGYQGDSLAERLKTVEPADFATLNDAWEAHKVRNQIAHQGSTFDLSESLVRRTAARYEAVFREFKII